MTRTTTDQPPFVVETPDAHLTLASVPYDRNRGRIDYEYGVDVMSDIAARELLMTWRHAKKQLLDPIGRGLIDFVESNLPVAFKIFVGVLSVVGIGQIIALARTVIWSLITLPLNINPDIFRDGVYHLHNWTVGFYLDSGLTASDAHGAAAIVTGILTVLVGLAILRLIGRLAYGSLLFASGLCERLFNVHWRAYATAGSYKFCPNCDKRLPVALQFCTECHHDQSQPAPAPTYLSTYTIARNGICPQCHTVRQGVEQTFCHNCGTRFDPVGMEN